MTCCVIFGGAGYIGTHLARHFLATGRFSHIHIADIRPSALEGTPGITTSITDVRQAIPLSLVPTMPTWIFNLAAIHREPGHAREEYFETNLKGAQHVCAYADATGCDNMHFTSSISVYGPTTGPTSEDSPIQPSTPYGASKYAAELFHEMWYRQRQGRRLFISRPGVIYGPGDPGNILRMITAIRRGYFAFPGSNRIFKSYGYIYGFLKSVEFVMDGAEDFVCYNYVETPTQPLGEIVQETKRYLRSRAVVLPVPKWVLLPTAKLVQTVVGNRNPIHPVRVKKVATPTHIVPQALLDREFPFAFTYRRSLEHWSQLSPQDFGLSNGNGNGHPHQGPVVLTRSAEYRVPDHRATAHDTRRAVGAK